MFKIDPNTQKIIAQRLWPTMLFLVVMTIVTGFMGYFWSSKFDNQIHSVIGFYAWFTACIIALFYGVGAFSKDVQIQIQQESEQAQ